MSDKNKSLIFDFFQIGSQLYIFLTGPIITSNLMVTIVQFIALFVLAESAWEMRRTKYYRVPDVGRQHELVTSGIYHYVRNPMYLAQLLFSGVLLIYSLSLLRMVAYIVLVVNFLYKIRYEEDLLRTHFEDFDAYKQTSRKLIPFIYRTYALFTSID